MDYKAELLKYVDLEGLAMGFLYDKVVEGIVMEKIKEVIPGEIDDAIIEGMKPMLRPMVEAEVKKALAKLKGEEVAA